MNRVTLIKQLFSDYKKFSPEPETRALWVWEHAWTSWLSTFNSHPKLQALSSPPIQSQRTLVYTQALFSSSKDIINLQWCLYIWHGNSSKKTHNHPTRQLFPTIVNKLYIMSPKCMFWVAFEIQKKKKRVCKGKLSHQSVKTPPKTSVEKWAKDRSANSQEKKYKQLISIWKGT